MRFLQSQVNFFSEIEQYVHIGLCLNAFVCFAMSNILDCFLKQKETIHVSLHLLSNFTRIFFFTGNPFEI